MPYFHDNERCILMMKVLCSLSLSGTSRNVLQYFPATIVEVLWNHNSFFEERRGYNFKEWRCTSLYLNSKIEIEHDCFLPIGRRPREVVTLTTRYFDADPPAQQTQSENIHWNLGLKNYLFIYSRIISKKDSVAAYRKVPKNSPKSLAEVMRVYVSSIASRSCFEPMLWMNKHKTIDRDNYFLKNFIEKNPLLSFKAIRRILIRSWTCSAQVKIGWAHGKIQHKITHLQSGHIL